MKIDISNPPDPAILAGRKKYIFWFAAAMTGVGLALAVGIYAVLAPAAEAQALEDWALGILVAAAVAVTWSGNRLQAYKKLFPPQRDKLRQLRALHPAVETYCAGVERAGRRFIRAEYEACVDYAEKVDEAHLP